LTIRPTRPRDEQSEIVLVQATEEVAVPDSDSPAEVARRGQTQPESPLNAVRPESWNALPESVRLRMIEFRQLARVYSESFEGADVAGLQSQERGLTLENIVELGLLNSRELQTQKETLYKAALAVSLEQFAYFLKFTPFGNGGDVLYRRLNTDGHYVSELHTTANAEVDRLMATGGTFVGRFANNVILTFNGPNGFASDVSSQLLFDLSQPFLQRDIRFEPLTRAERNLVYAARTYLRYRRTYFVQLATSYYASLRLYRQIAIESQNYFSLSGAHQQALVELEAGLRSRIQAEQIEQNMLAGRSRLIAAGVNLERALDRLKIDMGLPPELPLRIDLDELEDVTARDETAVAAEAVRRTRARLLEERNDDTPQTSLLINAAVVLQQRIAQWQKTRAGSPGQVVFDELEELGAQLALADAQLAVESQRRGLRDIEASPEPAAIRLVQRRLELLSALGRQIQQHLDLARVKVGESPDWRALSRESEAFAAKRTQLQEELAEVLDAARVEKIPELEQATARQLAAGENLLDRVDDLEGAGALGESEEARQARLVELVDQVLGPAEKLLADESTKLTPVEIELDDAMLTGLVQRLDLMNRRGELADARRLAKLAADDLRSVLNLQATQVVSNNVLEPAGWNFDTARSDVRLTLDLPLNRQQQRNAYRNALINYQASRRAVMLQEDTIKLAIRDDLRNLALAREQYQIGIASAALANERVSSTQLELALGFPGVAARDFLEAQDAFRLAVSGVADNHLGYIVNRIQFFLDIEELQLDEQGFWPGVRDEQLQPVPEYFLSPLNGAPYGTLPSYPWYSRELRCLFPDE
jgi:outer membrane protein TolC